MCKLKQLLLLSFLICSFAPGVSAVQLTEKQLDEVYSGALDSALTDTLTADASTVSSQKNVAVAGSTQGLLNNTRTVNTNRVTIRNEGDSGVSLQGNIASLTSLASGENRGNSIRNTNSNTIRNEVNTAEGPVSASFEGDSASSAGAASMLGLVSASDSSVAAQTNMAVVAVAGTLRNTDIMDENRATLRNTGDSAVAVQANTNLVSSLEAGENRNNDFRNQNRANIQNRVTDPDGSAEVSLDGLASTGIGNNSVSTEVLASNSAVSAQTNTGIVAVAGTNRDSDLNNDNYASINNRGDSGVAMQANVAVLASLGSAENRNNDIRNDNSARVDNSVEDDSGSVEASLEDRIITGAGTIPLLSSVNSNQSAVAIQDNIGMLLSEGNAARSTIRNSNDARVSNTSGL